MFNLLKCLNCAITVATISFVLSQPKNSVYATTAVKTDFCYHHKDCDPTTWGGECNGKRQSPINLPVIHSQEYYQLPWINLRIMGYHGSHFRLRNNGHAISIDFASGDDGVNEGPTNLTFPFPEPVASNYDHIFDRTPLQYKFKSAHFHWGVNDTAVGSEHCIAGHCSAMELHFVHFLSKYENIREAVYSKDPNALAVLAILIEVSPFYRHPNPILAPIVENLDKVKICDHDASVEIDKSLDFTALFFEEVPPVVYSYKGSLTTPPCNEIVNWFVMRKQSYASHSDLEAFRRVKDSHNITLTENHRPLQPRNGRQILVSKVAPWD